MSESCLLKFKSLVPISTQLHGREPWSLLHPLEECRFWSCELWRKKPHFFVEEIISFALLTGGRSFLCLCFQCLTTILSSLHFHLSFSASPIFPFLPWKIFFSLWMLWQVQGCTLEGLSACWPISIFWALTSQACVTGTPSGMMYTEGGNKVGSLGIFKTSEIGSNRWPDLKGKQFKDYGSYRGGYPAMEVQIIFHCWAFSFL